MKKNEEEILSKTRGSRQSFWGWFGLSFLAIFIVPIPVFATDYTSNSFIVRDPILSNDGGLSTSTSFTYLSSTGQTVLGSSTSTSFTQNSGFLYFSDITSPTLSATAGDSQASLSWTAATSNFGFSIASYEVGQSTGSGGPYTFTNVGNVLSSTRTGLTNGTTYYFVIQAIDNVGDTVATSTEQSVTPIASTAGGTAGGGGSFLNTLGSLFTPTSPNEEPPFKIIINNQDKFTTFPIVDLSLDGGPNAVKMAISNTPDFIGVSQQDYKTEIKDWNLCPNLLDETCPEEEKTYTVYAKFYSKYGVGTDIVSDNIIFKKETTVIDEVVEIIEKIPETITEVSKEIISEIIEEIIKPTLPDFVLEPGKITGDIKLIFTGIILKPGKISKIIEPIFTDLISPKKIKEIPLAFKEQFELISSKIARGIISAPLPKEVKLLVQKFPKLGNVFEKVGISKISDIKKLKNVKLILPSLSQTIAFIHGINILEYTTLPSTRFLPITNLPVEIKKEIPTEIVFAGSQNVDFNIKIDINDRGEVKQKINTISRKPLQLTVVPENPVKTIKGYMVFKKRNKQSSLESFFSYIKDSFIISPVSARGINIEEEFVLVEFEYTDPDGDGVYTAEINTPAVEGEYEIITIMDYQDESLGQKELRLVTVIDPEGYIYEAGGGKNQTRIREATISMFWENPQTKKFELWPAKEYLQENPQVTGYSGEYSFLVPEGVYYLQVEAENYDTYIGEPFQVTEGVGVHENIELRGKYYWIKRIDWKMTIILILFALLTYNFYKDKKFRKEKC